MQYFPAGQMSAQAAVHIIQCERNRLPDLSHAVVVLPALQASGGFAGALREAAGGTGLLLPRMTTFAQWTDETPAGAPVASRTAREALLYQELQQRAWLRSADLWAVSAELAGLFDELTRNNLSLPKDLEAFNRQLEQAYRAKTGASLTFEARLIHELWHVMAGATGSVDAAAAYQLRLAHLAERASAPLYVVGAGRMLPAEQQFLEHYAEKAPVCRIETGPGDDALHDLLASAWPRETDAPMLLERAARLKQSCPGSPLAERMRIIGATSPEQEAQAIDMIVREWLLEGRRHIAIVVHDRLVARRARALLERAQVLVKDEAGWAFSTTSAATVIGRWLDVAGGDGYYRDLLDLLKSPFVFHDWARDARRQAVWRLEQYVREDSVISGIGNFVRLAEDRNDHELRQMLAGIRQGVARLGRSRKSIARWLEALLVGLQDAGVRSGLTADSAGVQLLDLIERLGHELDSGGPEVDFPEWRRWLARQLESETYRDQAIDSTVVFTSLAATRLRQFDAVLLSGCDAAHLPGPDPAALFFNQGVRAELGLPTWAERVQEMEQDLAALIAANPRIVVTWQSMLGGERNLPSPLVERLNALHGLAWGGVLDDDLFIRSLAAGEVMPEGQPLAVVPTRVPDPSAPARLPQGISASGYNALLACPYQFYARYMLRLAELDDVQEMIEKSDYGTIVHGVLAEFHRLHPVVSDMGSDEAVQELERLSVAAFADDVARNYLAQAWQARWQALIPAYLDWQRAREAEGWLWRAAEAKRSVTIATPQGRKLTLRGRIDRVDEREGTAAVIDYKTSKAKKLKDALRIPGEDVQLPVYALLWGGPVAAALFLSVEREGVEPVALEEDIQSLAAASRERLGGLFDALAAGATLPAQGTEQACEYCEMRGLCRRNHWT